ncbi:helix-turn-helix domain-containing protein [Fibrisoma montanum]|nr:helix-turn-helix transcriptional regulator [Fibrisoma montanum]
MKTKPVPVKVLDTVTEYTRFYDLPAPLHPLLTVLDLGSLHRQPVEAIPATMLAPVVQQFYMVSLKQGLGRAAIRYGHQAYDFNEGVMSFLAPGQGCWLANVANADEVSEIFTNLTGWTLLVHPDLLAKYPLGQKITRYGFFSYDTNEALHLSAAEEVTLNQLISTIQAEAERPVDAFSQDVLVAQIDLLLTYADRFYHRQFLTRRTAEVNREEDSLLTRFEARLTGYFAQQGEHPLPTVQSLANDLNVSPAYLSDMLRSQTGQNTQQHIHNALIEKAKRLLMATSLSVNETAYQLGFEYPHYFSRLFKKKTGLTPAEFRMFMQ